MSDEFITPPEDPVQRARRLHWRGTRALTLGLLAVWALSTFGLVAQARALDARFFGWPVGFWGAAQGLMLLDLALVGVYAWAMRRLDARLQAQLQDRLTPPPSASPSNAPAVGRSAP